MNALSIEKELEEQRKKLEEQSECITRQLIEGPVFILDCSVEPIYTKKDVQEDNEETD